MSNTNGGRVIGLLLLVVFALGVLTFQVLQQPVLSGPSGIANVALHSTQIVFSVFVSLLGGSISIGIAVLFFPVFERSSQRLAILYVAFAVVNFVAIAIDSASVLSVLELSGIIADETNLTDRLEDGLVTLVYGRQWWTHHMYLLISSIPVIFMYSGLYVTRAVPRVFSLLGIIAPIIMAVEMVAVMLNTGISNLLFIPIALVQLATPLWLLARGYSQDERQR